MLVLRVETDSGEGPYVSSVLRTIVCNLGDENLAYDLRGRHPTPIDDSLYRRNSKAKTGSDYGFTPGEHVFGFEDYRQFRSWFYSDIVLKALSDDGFELSVYDCPESDTIVGNTQLTFNKQTAVKRASFPLDIGKETLQFNLDALKN